MPDPEQIVALGEENETTSSQNSILPYIGGKKELVPDAAADSEETVLMPSMAVCAAQLDDEEAFPSLALDAGGRGPTLLLRHQGSHKAAAGEQGIRLPAPMAAKRGMRMLT